MPAAGDFHTKSNVLAMHCADVMQTRAGLWTLSMSDVTMYTVYILNSQINYTREMEVVILRSYNTERI